jgi:hypothetical protein
MMIVLLTGDLLSAGTIGGGEHADKAFSSSVKNGINNTKRDYLLVHAPSTKQEKNIHVISKCEKPVNAEGVYGECTHEVRMQPTNKQFTLRTGEDVVMTELKTTDAPLIFATIGYGCCMDPSTVRFYSESGKYLGTLFTYGAKPITFNPVVKSTVYIGNATSYKDKIFLLTNRSEKSAELQALVFDSKKLVGQIPVSLPIFSTTSNCGPVWYIEDFATAGGSLTLRLADCDVAGSETLVKKTFTCSVTEKEITCLPTVVDRWEESETRSLILTRRVHSDAPKSGA